MKNSEKFKTAAEREKSLPCPWCGGESVVAKSDYGTRYVMCSNAPCGAEGPASQTSEGAVAMWNKVARMSASGRMWREDV